MKKEIPKIAAIFLITVAVVVWGLNFIFLGKAPKSKADEVLTLSFDPQSAAAANNVDFTIAIKATPTGVITIQLYKININFDKSKVKIKDNRINYVVGQPSSALGGDDNSKISAINGDSGQGTIKLYGEITNPVTGLIMNGATELARVTFTSKTDSDYTVTNSDSSVSKVNADYSIVTVPLSNATFNVNGGGSTLTPTPTCSPLPAVCLQLYPTVCPTQAPTGGWCAPSGGVILNLKLKFQGILKKPGDPFNALVVKVFPISSSGIKSCGQAQFSANENGVWSATVSSWDTTTEGCLTPQPGNNFKILVKGPYHIQKKICDAGPTETAGGTYRCAKGNITLVAGNNNLDLSGIVLLAGDLPDQDGSVTAYDTSFIYNNLGKTDNNKCDVNRDGICDTQDYSLVIAALSVKNDEE